MAVVDGDILRFTAQLDLGRGSTMQHVYTYEYSGSGDTDAEVGSQIKGKLDQEYDHLEDVLDQLVVSEQVTAWLWDAILEEWNGIYSDVWETFSGQTVGQQLPNGAAVLLKLLTGKPRRQGRKFVSGASNAHYVDAGWTAASLVNIALFGAGIIGSVATANGTLDPGVFNQITQSFIPFTTSIVINTFANYQRRRRPGVGI